jgi:ankyrin repeat protein
LHVATNENHIEVVRALLRAGADHRVKNQNGKTALDLASSKGHRDIEELLLGAGVKRLGF